MTTRRLWPTHRRTDDRMLQLAWGLLQGLVVGAVVMAVLAVIVALT